MEIPASTLNDSNQTDYAEEPLYKRKTNSAYVGNLSHFPSHVRLVVIAHRIFFHVDRIVVNFLSYFA